MRFFFFENIFAELWCHWCSEFYALTYIICVRNRGSRIGSLGCWCIEFRSNKKKKTLFQLSSNWINDAATIKTTRIIRNHTGFNYIRDGWCARTVCLINSFHNIHTKIKIIRQFSISPLFGIHKVLWAHQGSNALWRNFIYFTFKEKIFTLPFPVNTKQNKENRISLLRWSLFP